MGDKYTANQLGSALLAAYSDWEGSTQHLTVPSGPRGAKRRLVVPVDAEKQQAAGEAFGELYRVTKGLATTHADPRVRASMQAIVAPFDQGMQRGIRSTWQPSPDLDALSFDEGDMANADFATRLAFAVADDSGELLERGQDGSYTVRPYGRGGPESPLRIASTPQMDEALVSLGTQGTTPFQGGALGLVEGLSEGGDIGGGRIRQGTLAAAVAMGSEEAKRLQPVDSVMGRMPFVLPFGGTPDEDAAMMRDPRAMAAVAVRLRELKEAGRIDASTAENIGKALGFVGSFALSRGVWKGAGAATGAGLKGVGRAVEKIGERSLVSGPGLVKVWGTAGKYAGTLGRASGIAGEYPLLGAGMHLMADSVKFEVLNAALDPTRKDLGLASGVGMGFEMGMFAGAARFGRALATPLLKGALRLGGAGPWLDELAHTARAGGASDAAIDRFMKMLAQGRAKSITPAMQQAVAAGPKVASRLALAGQSADALSMGWLMGAWGAAHAEAGDRWDALPWTERVSSMLRHMDSPEAVGSGIGFVMGAGAHGLRDMRARRPGQAAIEAQGERLLRETATGAMLPWGPYDVKAAAEVLDALHKQRPDVVVDSEIALTGRLDPMGTRQGPPTVGEALRRRLDLAERLEAGRARVEAKTKKARGQFEAGDLTGKQLEAKTAAAKESEQRRYEGEATPADMGLSEADVAAWRAEIEQGREARPVERTGEGTVDITSKLIEAFGPEQLGRQMGLSLKTGRGEELTPEERANLEQTWASGREVDAQRKLEAQLRELGMLAESHTAPDAANAAAEAEYMQAREAALKTAGAAGTLPFGEGPNAAQVDWSKLNVKLEHVLPAINEMRRAAGKPEYEKVEQIPATDAVASIVAKQGLRDIAKKKSARTAKSKTPPAEQPQAQQAPQKLERSAPAAAAGPTHPSLLVPKLVEGKDAIAGEATEVLAGDRRLPARYAVIEADRAVPSHDARTFQPNEAGDINVRPYHDPNAGQKLREGVIQRAEQFAPAEVLSTGLSATSGTPIVRENGVVLGGNGRTMSMQRAFADPTSPQARAYRAELERQASLYGIDPASFAGIVKPMLVRVLPERVAGAPGEVSALLNESSALAESPSAQAASRGKLIAANLERFAPMLEGRALSDLFASRGLTADLVKALQEVGAWSGKQVDELIHSETGLLTPTGKANVRAIMLGAIVPDVRAMDMLQPQLKTQLEGIVVPAIRLMSVWPEFRAVLDRAIDGAWESKHTGKGVDKLLEQQTIGGSEWTTDPRATQLVRALEGGSYKQLGAKLSELAEKVREAGAGQADMFGGEPKTPTAIWEDVFGVGKVAKWMKAPQQAPKPVYWGGSARALREAGESPSDTLTFSERLEHASNSYDHAASLLKRGGLLAADAPPGKAHEAFDAVASDSATAREAFIQELGPLEGPALWSEARNAIAQADSHQAMALFQRYKLDGRVNSAKVLDALLSVAEQMKATGDIDAPLRKRLADLKMLDERGDPDYRVPQELAYNSMLSEMARQAERRRRGPDPDKAGRAINPLEAALHFAGMFRRVGRELGNAFRPGQQLDNDFLLARLTDLNTYMRLAGRDSGARLFAFKPTRDANRWLTENIGRSLQAAGMPQVLKDSAHKAREVLFAPASGRANKEVADAAFVANFMRGPLTPWGEFEPPTRMKEGILKLIEQGRFARGEITSARDVEKHLGAGSGYLFDYALEWNKHWREAADTAVRSHWLSPAQAQEFKDRYVPKVFLDEKGRVEQPGISTTPFAGRDLRRAPGGGQRIWDPDVLLRVAGSQEARLTHWNDVLGQLTGGPRYGLSKAEVDKLPADLRDYYRPIADPNGSDFQRRMHEHAEFLRGRMQSRDAWLRGDQVQPGEAPYIEGRVAMLDALVPRAAQPAQRQMRLGEVEKPRESSPGPSGELGTHVDIRTLQELEMLWDTLESRGYQPGSGARAYWAHQFSNLTQYARRSFTVLRPVFWFKNFVTSLGTNSMVLPRRDFVQSILTGRGHYANWTRYGADFGEWVRAGMPDYATKEGSAKIRELGLDKAGIVKFDQIVTQMGGSTLRAALGANASHSELMRALGTPGPTRVTPSGSGDGTNEALLQGYERGLPSLEKIDARLHELLSSGDPAKRIQAMREADLVYSLIELTFKGAAIDSIHQNNPQMPWRTAMSEGFRRTADYRELPWFFKRARTWTQRLQNPERPKDWTRELVYATVGSPLFVAYKLAGTPVFMREVMRRPFSALSTAAITSGLMALWLRATNSDDELELRLALGGTGRATGLGTPSKDELAVYADRMGNQATVQPGITEESVGRLLTQWKGRWKSAEPFTIATGHERFADVAELADPLIAPYINAARVMRDGPASAGATMLGDFVSVAPDTLRSFVGWLGDVSMAARGQGSKLPSRVAVEAIEAAGNQFASPLHPATFWASREARRMVEAMHGDQPFSQIMLGQKRLYEQSRPDYDAMRGLVDMLGVTKRIPQALLAGRLDDESLLDNAIDQTFGGAVKKMMLDSPARMNHAKQAVRATRDWIVEMMAQEYDRSIEHGSDWEAMVLQRLSMQPGDYEIDARGNGRITPQAKSPLARYIATLGPERESDAIEFANKFVTQSFAVPTFDALLMAAQTRGMSPALFKRIAYTSIMDDSGMALLGKMHQDLIANGKGELAPDWYNFFTQIPEPSGLLMRDRWRELHDYFSKMPVRGQDFPSKRPKGPLELLGPGAFDAGANTAREALLELQSATGKRK